MRRITVFVLVALVAACGDGGSNDDGAVVVDRSRPVPADVRVFLRRVVDERTIAFDATYHVLAKLGSTEHTIEVHVDPPSVTIIADGHAVGAADDVALSQYGVFSGFLSRGPARAIQAAARRADAGPARFSTHPAAPDAFDCVEIPEQGAVTSTWCLNGAGIFGYVDTPAVRYQLTRFLEHTTTT